MNEPKPPCDIDDLKYAALKEIVDYAQAGLWLDENDRWDLDKEISGADYVAHMTNILADHGLMPEPAKPAIHLQVDEEKGATAGGDITLVRDLAGTGCPAVLLSPRLEAWIQAQHHADASPPTPDPLWGDEARVVVAASDTNGEPRLLPYTVPVTEAEVVDGLHYALAKQAAEDDGYEGPMLAFDEDDGPAFLFANRDWDSVPAIHRDEQGVRTCAPPLPAKRCFDVHLFAVVRVKVSGVVAASHGAAIDKAIYTTDLHGRFGGRDDQEYAEEISHYLVDVVGDAEYSDSRWFHDPGQPFLANLAELVRWHDSGCDESELAKIVKDARDALAATWRPDESPIKELTP